ncbi:hypothetical protein PQR12_23510 [Paraburkholderia nemoris]|uniref:hypothetical protein n=1 Tax=Paraburkholderia nemoris TaxID=2793076 RepID=UPI0038B7C22C
MGSIPFWLIPLSVLFVLLVSVSKNQLLGSRQAQTQRAKEEGSMKAKMLRSISISGLEVTQGLGVGMTAGATLA